MSFVAGLRVSGSSGGQVHPAGFYGSSQGAIRIRARGHGRRLRPKSLLPILKSVRLDNDLESGCAGLPDGLYSNSEWGKPDWRIIDLRVPARNSP